MRAPGWVPRLWPALPAAVYLLLPTRNFYRDGVPRHDFRFYQMR
jgi:hypothetical protein